MPSDIQSYIWDGSALGMVALVFALLSVLAAFYAQTLLSQMTRRTPYAAKQFGAEVDPWMAEARQSYAKEKLVGRRGKVEPQKV